MARDYYHSYDWKIVSDNTKTRVNGYRILLSLSCPTPRFYSYKINDLLNDTNIINSILPFSPYFMICETVTSSGPQIGSANVRNIETVYGIINKAFDAYGGNAVISFIQQIKYSEQSFVAAALSSGDGKVIIEILNGTVDTRELTSKGAEPSKLSMCIFWDIDCCELKDVKLYEKCIDIYNYCWWKKGYYEITHGVLDGKLGSYFTFFSNISTYINGLDYAQPDYELFIRTRLLLLSENKI